MNKLVVAAVSAFAFTSLWATDVFADGTEAEDTGDEFAPDQVDPDPAKMSQSEAASLIRAAGISVYSSGGCTNRNRSNCTSFEQINSATVNGIITFKKSSGCSVTITGGTETGHASGTYSHWNGYKVDVSITSCVTGYIHKNFSYIGLRGDGAPLYRSAAGNLYADEGNHWDITYF